MISRPFRKGSKRNGKKGRKKRGKGIKKRQGGRKITVWRAIKKGKWKAEKGSKIHFVFEIS